jgi:HTH-type transcriptional regulator/antitoxin HigA
MGAPMGERIPAEVFPPGEVIREELEARGWSQVELADIMGRPPRVVSEIISGKRAITPETAKGLGAAFGTGPTFWINLEGSYQLSRTAHDDDAVQRRAKLYAKAPVNEMIKRGWIRHSDNVAVLEQQVCGLLNIQNIEDSPWHAHAAYKGKSDSELSLAAQWAWFHRTRQIATSISVPSYSEKALREAVGQLKTLLLEPEEARHVPKILTECGVRFVIVEKPPHADIDGVCFWIAGQPVIGMSLRRDKIDNFWFVLRHEIEHVLRGDGKVDEIIDTDLEGDRAGTDTSLPNIERVANAAAADFCVPKDKMESFMARKHPFYSEKDVIAFARVVSRHPGIVVGQMQRRLNNYAYLTRRISKIRQFVLPEAIADGWGQTAQIA